MGEKERGFASFFFGWELDKQRTRLIFYTVADLNGRNIRRYSNTLKEYPRWVEQGYRGELMRWTDFANSLTLLERERLTFLTNMNLLTPSQAIINDLWNLARRRMSSTEFIEHC